MAHGTVFFCSLKVVERHYNLLYSLCKEFDFHLPCTGSLAQALEQIDVGFFSGHLTQFSLLSERRAWYKYKGEQLKLATTYILRLGWSLMWRMPRTVLCGCIRAWNRC